MEGKTGRLKSYFFLLLWGAGAAGVFSSRAQSPRPSIPRFSSDAFKDCLSYSDRGWTLTCSLAQFLEKAKKEDPSPQLSLIVGRVLQKEIFKIKAENAIGILKIQKVSQYPLPPLPPLSPALDLKSLGQLSLRDFVEQIPHTFENPEGLVLSQSESVVAAAREWLRPLFKNSPLSIEAGLCFFEILGDSLRFREAQKMLTEEAFFLQERWARIQVVRKVSDWVEFENDANLKKWLRERLQEIRPAEINASIRSEELFYWLRSLELEKSQKHFDVAAVKQSLRQLLVAVAAKEDIQKIQATSKDLLGHELPVPTDNELNLKELTIRAQAQVRNLESPRALATISEVLDRKHGSYSLDEFWSAFQLHIRILRILDRRDAIPAVVEKYRNKENFLEVRAKAPGRSKAFERALDTAKMYWTYEDAPKALAGLEKIIPVATRLRENQALSQALYLKARILEQGADKRAAIAFFDSSLKNLQLPSDLLLDLNWRKAFLHLDLAEKKEDFEKIFSMVEKIKSPTRDSLEQARSQFWLGYLKLLADDKEKAKGYFREAYKTEALSYYSNLAALHLTNLGEKVEGWKLPSTTDLDKPDFKSLFKNGQKEIARVYYLAEIGDETGASRGYGDIDKVLWTKVLSSRIPAGERLEYARGVAWLRLALADSVGSLRAAEVARQAFGDKLEATDWAYLFPLPYWNDIQAIAKNNQIDPWFVASLIRQESAFNPRARSGANAVGLMQMIPPVAQAEAKKVGRKNFEVTQLYDPPVALELGIHHLKGLLSGFDNSWITAIASYNAGSPPIKKWLGYYPQSLPLSFIERISYTETRNYVKSILRNFVNYQRIYANGEVSLDALLKLPLKAQAEALSAAAQ